MNTERKAYNYSVLRYVHDAVTGEFLNVGVVLFVPATRKILTRMSSSLLRLHVAFPACNTSVLQRQLQRLESRLKATDLSSSGVTLRGVVAKELPESDGKFQWSEVSAGVCVDPVESLGALYERLVSRRELAYEMLDMEHCRPEFARVQYRAQPRTQQVLASNDGWSSPEPSIERLSVAVSG